MKEEISRLQTQVVQLRSLPKKRSIVSETPISTVAPSTPPESPCNSFPSSDLFDTLNKADQEDGQINGTATEDWVTVTKKSNNRRSKGSLRSVNRSSRRVRIFFLLHVFT